MKSLNKELIEMKAARDEILNDGAAGRG